MQCRLCMFLMCLLISLFSLSSYAQCKDREYVNWMGGKIEEQKAQLGGIASLIPTSLALGQAILESSYGTSFSAKKRNNHFGLSSKGKLIEFVSVNESIIFYLETLQEHRAYRVFRNIIMNGVDDSYKLITVIAKSYADDIRYDKKVSAIIKKCDLQKFDETKIASF